MPSLAELLEEQSVVLMEATIPPDMTLDEWRRRHARPSRRPQRVPRWLQPGRRGDE
jgi:hypothetical protein